MPSKNKTGRGAFCNRVADLSLHHLIPRKLHRSHHYRRQFDRDALALLLQDPTIAGRVACARERRSDVDHN